MGPEKKKKRKKVKPPFNFQHRALRLVSFLLRVAGRMGVDHEWKNPFGEDTFGDHIGSNDQDDGIVATNKKPERTLTTLGLVVVGFFWTSGGFYGSEIAMEGPPLYVLILCLAMPLLYSLPTALISAELATNYPETGGQCVYVTLACGEIIGAHNTWWVGFSTAVDAAIYPQYVRDSLMNEFGDSIPSEVYEYMPIMVICFITLINIAGVDWLVRFETFLGVMALLPCLVILGYGVPVIKTEPLQSIEGTLNLQSIVSRSLWLYGGFTNLGVLAGEAKTPRRSYLIAVAVLVPLKILLRFVPFLIAYSNGVDGADLSSAGYFAVMAGELGGEWLRWWYFAGSIVCFLGFYNAMAVNCERTAFYFCEERFHETLESMANTGCIGRFFFKMPGEGGIRRVYILLVAVFEIALINIDVGLLVELEMLIYAMSAGLFFYAFVYLRVQRTRMFKMGPSDPTRARLLKNDDDQGMPYSLDADSQSTKQSEIYNIGGGNVVAFMMVIVPVSVFAINTVLNLIDSGVIEQGDNATEFVDEGETKVPFPYFKLVCFFATILVGLIAHLITHLCTRKKRVLI
eukprot:m.84521 g.84521  ORF g.84521 m.84521 type:complete len:572 (+) comp25761_c0_seq1:1823-3538(+)